MKVVCKNNQGYENLLTIGNEYEVMTIDDCGVLLENIANVYFTPSRFMLAEEYADICKQETCTLKILHRSNIATVVECQSCKSTFNGTFSNIHGVPQSNPKYCIHCGRKVNNIEM